MNPEHVFESNMLSQYLKWTLHFALFYEPVTDRKWHCYTDASWSPEGDYSHQAVAIYYDTNLVAWQSQRQSLVALSSAEAELIASVWGNRLALSLYGQLMEMILDKLKKLLSMSISISASFGLYCVHFHCMSNASCP